MNLKDYEYLNKIEGTLLPTYMATIIDNTQQSLNDYYTWTHNNKMHPLDAKALYQFLKWTQEHRHSTWGLV